MKYKLAGCLTLLAVFTFCKGNPHDINVKRDFEYMYNVIETSFLTLDKGIKSGKINKSLDAIEKYVSDEKENIRMVGVRLNSIILKEEESYEIIRFNEKYAALTAKYINFFEANLNPTQKDRFVTVVVEGVAQKFTDELMVPKSSTDFFMKAIR